MPIEVMVEEEGVPGCWKMGVRDRSGRILIGEIGDTGMRGAAGGGVEEGGEGGTPFIGAGDDGSGIRAGGTCSGCGSSLTSGSGSVVCFGIGSGEEALGPRSCSLMKDFPWTVAVGKSSTIVPGEGTRYRSEAITGVVGSRSREKFDGLGLTETWEPPPSSSGTWGCC